MADLRRALSISQARSQETSASIDKLFEGIKEAKALKDKRMKESVDIRNKSLQNELDSAGKGLPSFVDLEKGVVPVRQEIAAGVATAKAVQMAEQRKNMEQMLKSLQGGNSFQPGSSLSFKDPGTGVTVSTPVNRKFTEGETKTLGQADVILEELDVLEESLGKKGEILGALPFGAGSKSGQRFKLAREDINERLVRLRSGAQINEEEFKRLSNLLPKILRRTDVDKEQLQRFRKEFSSIKQRIEGGQSAPNPKEPVDLKNKKDSFTQSDQDLINFVMGV